VRRLGDSTARMLGATLDPSSVLVDDRFLGAGYPIPSEAGDAAVALLARLEGLELDRVYTGKAAAGLIHLAETGAIAEGGRTLFVHTGGNGGLYY
jgi:1-aminocyclopropane-1-carboxylate deaminase/D-cysteine desulfhydrase-like pyridoxal-dependent ACC family enzyme